MTPIEKSNILRQLTDIQIQADRIINGKPSEQEIEQFSQYSEELKYYCLDHILQQDIQRLLLEIPMVDMNKNVETLGCIALFAPSILLAYFVAEQQKSSAKQDVRIIKEKYAHIAFFAKNYLR